MVETTPTDSGKTRPLPTGDCFTIGHSNQPFVAFAQLLIRHEARVVADVRSTPYSKRLPQFNREPLQSALETIGIEYAYMGDRLGARYTDPSLIRTDGRVDLLRVAQLPQFQSAIRWLVHAIDQGRRIALMCSEGDPFKCHRFVLISRVLQSEGVRVVHILPDGGLVENHVLEERLVRTYFPESNDEPGLFPSVLQPREELLRLAYERHAIDVAYRTDGFEEDQE
jgi:uncharacterized protein (DUF488 family)